MINSKAIPDTIAQHYSSFRVSERLLLNGQSHQAWPDCAYNGLQKAWDDAASHMDDKWQNALQHADTLRHHITQMLDDTGENIALAQNTHFLLIQFLSSLELSKKPRIVTSDGEFHTVRRQLSRLAEEGLDIQIVSVEPLDTFARRFCQHITASTSAAILSHVFYETALVTPGVDTIAAHCIEHDCLFMLDIYHSLNVIPVSIKQLGLEQAYIIGGGYKYMQMGEGNAFMRLPENCQLRPVITGWFSEFAQKADHPATRVSYDKGPSRFAGATYDPVSHYRATEVIDFFTSHHMTPAALYALNRHQLDIIHTCILENMQHHLTLANPDYPHNQGGFLSCKTNRTALLHNELRSLGLICDYRGDYLRLGPAPYVSDRQILQCMELLDQAIQQVF